MIIIENQIDFDNVQNFLTEAQERFDALSGTLDKADISKLVENLSKTEPELAVALGSLNESMQLNEFIVKHVSSKGEVTKTKDLKTRQREATQTTGLSKSARRQIARKAAKTRKANPSIQLKSNKKRKKALKKRKMLGLS